MTGGQLAPDVADVLGLKRGPMLLGRSYRAMSMHVSAVRDLRIANDGSDPALDLIAHTLAAVSTDDREALTTALGAVIEAAAVLLGRVDPLRYPHRYAPSDGPAFNCWECNFGRWDERHRPTDPGELAAWEDAVRRDLARLASAQLTAVKIKAIAASRGAHIYDDGAGGIWEHPGPADGCNAPECRPADGSVTPCPGCEHARHPGQVCRELRMPAPGSVDECGCTPSDAMRAATKHGLEGS